MRYQLSKEAVASPQCIWMSKFAPNRASHCCAVTVPQQHLGTDFFLNPSSSVNTKRTVSRLIFTSSAIRSNRFSYPCCAVTCPCFLMVVRCAVRLQQRFYPVAYPGILFGGRGVQKIQLRTDRTEIWGRQQGLLRQL